MELSLDWHLKKRMGVALRVIDRGQTSADQVIRYLVLRLLPNLGQVVVVMLIYIVRFRVPTLSVVLFLGMALYTVLTCKPVCTAGLYCRAVCWAQRRGAVGSLGATQGGRRQVQCLLCRRPKSRQGGDGGDEGARACCASGCRAVRGD